MLTIIKMLIFLCSTIGYYFFIYKKTNISKEFLPIVAIAIQIFVLFIGGIIHLLGITCILLYIFGLIMFILYLYRYFKEYKIKGIINLIKNNINFVILFFLLFILALALKGHLFSHYDNFSHWALVVKKMLQTNRFPNSLDTIITFTQYPLGSSSYIYYFSKMISRDESIQMLANTFIILSALFPILKYRKKNNYIYFLFYIVFINFILCVNNYIDTLLVDTLLPCVGFSVLFFIYSEGYKKNNPYYKYLLIPLLSTLMLIKNSGIFFVILVLMEVLYLSKKKMKIERKNYFIMLLAPCLTYVVWYVHCLLNFRGSRYAKHSMSIFNYFQILKGKTLIDIKKTFIDILKNSISGESLYLIIIVGLFVFLLLFILSRKRKEHDILNKYSKTMRVMLLIYLIYIIGMLGMYVFSMPQGEANSLAGFERYRLTIFVFIYCFLALYCTKIINFYNERIKKILFTILLCAIFILPTMIINKSLEYPTIFNTMNTYPTRNILDNIIKNNNLPNGKRYVFFIDELDYGYVYFLSQYLLDTPDVEVVYDLNEMEIDFSQYDYIVSLASKNKNIIDYLNNNYPDDFNKQVITLDKEKN